MSNLHRDLKASLAVTADPVGFSPESLVPPIDPADVADEILTRANLLPAHERPEFLRRWMANLDRWAVSFPEIDQSEIRRELERRP